MNVVFVCNFLLLLFLVALYQDDLLFPAEISDCWSVHFAWKWNHMMLQTAPFNVNNVKCAQSIKLIELHLTEMDHEWKAWLCWASFIVQSSNSSLPNRLDARSCTDSLKNNTCRTSLKSHKNDPLSPFLSSLFWPQFKTCQGQGKERGHIGKEKTTVIDSSSSNS